MMATDDPALFFTWRLGVWIFMTESELRNVSKRAALAQQFDRGECALP